MTVVRTEREQGTEVRTRGQQLGLEDSSEDRRTAVRIEEKQGHEDSSDDKRTAVRIEENQGYVVRG